MTINALQWVSHKQAKVFRLIQKIKMHKTL